MFLQEEGEMHLICGKNYLLSQSCNKTGNRAAELLSPCGTRKLLSYTAFIITTFPVC